MSRKNPGTKKKRGGCLIFILIFLLAIVLAAVGAVGYFTKAPIQISERPQTVVVQATQNPDVTSNLYATAQRGNLSVYPSALRVA